MINNLMVYEVVELNGKEYKLKFDYNATCDLEDIFGKGVAVILSEEQIGFRMVRAFYWAGLKWKDKGITLDRVGNMLGKEIQENGKSIMDLMPPVMNALKKSGLLGNAPKDEFADDDENENEADDQGEENPNE